MTEAIAIADRMLDPNAEGFDTIDFHNIAAMSEVILKLTNSKRDEVARKGELLFTALNYYHIGRGSK
jgi:hypothetical protein